MDQIKSNDDIPAVDKVATPPRRTIERGSKISLGLALIGVLGIKGTSRLIGLHMSGIGRFIPFSPARFLEAEHFSSSFT